MAFFKYKIDAFKTLIGPNISSMVSSNTCSNVLIWNLAYISVISWSFFKIVLLKIGLISTYKMPPCLPCYLIRALRYSSGNIWTIGILYTGHLGWHRASQYANEAVTSLASFAYESSVSAKAASMENWQKSEYSHLNYSALLLDNKTLIICNLCQKS